MAANGLLVAALLLLATVLPSQSATFKLWDLVSSKDGDANTITQQGKHYRAVSQGENVSVIYENYDGAQVQVASIQDRDDVMPASFQLHVTVETEASVSFSCGETTTTPVSALTSVIHGSAPRTEMTFNNETNSVHFTVKRNTEADPSRFHINIYVARDRLAAGSTIHMSGRHSKVEHDSKCSTEAHISLTHSSHDEEDLCSERSETCEHLCDPATGSCACTEGYIVDTKNPSKCLETHLVSMTIPGLQKSAEQFHLLPAGLEMYLVSRFSNIAQNGIHNVTVNHDNVDVTTVDSGSASAQDHAHRLVRALSDADETFTTGLALSAPVDVRSSSPVGVSAARSKRQVPICTNLQVVVNRVVQGLDLNSLKLPTDFDLMALCTDVTKIVRTKREIVIPIPVPDALASTLLPGSSTLKDTTLSLTVSINPVRVLSLSAQTTLVAGASNVEVSISFNVETGVATMSGQVNGLSVSDILSVFSPGLASSSGLEGVSADEVELSVEFGKKTATRFYFRLLISSARNVASSLIGAAGLPADGLQDALAAANLDSFDIRDVEVLASNEGGRLFMKVNGRPQLPQFDVPIFVEISAIDVGTPQRSVSYIFDVAGSIDLAAALKGFIPTLDLTSIPGFGDLQLPGFGLSIRKPRIGLPALPTLPDFSAKLPKVRSPLRGVNLPRFQLPGVNFNAVFSPSIGNPLSIGGGLGVGPLCLNMKDNVDQSPASLNAIVQSLFSSLDIQSLNLPEAFEDLLDISVSELCYNRTNKTFTADVSWPNTIELIPSKPGYLSLTNTNVRVVIDASRKPVQFDFSAESTTTLATFPLQVAFTRERSGAFMFTATPTRDEITTGDVAKSFGSAGAELQQALDAIQLSDVTLSNLKIEIFKTPDLTMRMAATVSYRDLPSVSFEMVVHKPFQAGSYLALGIRTTSTTFAQVVGSVLPSIDISDVPLVGDLTVPATAVLVRSTGALSAVNMPFDDTDIKSLASKVTTTKISLLFPVNFPRVGKKNFIAAFKGISFDFKAPDADTSLLDMLQLAAPAVPVSDLQVPDGLPGLENVYIQRLRVDVAKKSMCVQARLEGQTFDIVPSYLSMDSIAFNLCMMKKRGATDVNFNVAGSITLGTVQAEAMITKKGNMIEMATSIPQRMGVADVLTAFGSTIIPDGDALTAVLTQNGFDSFGLTQTSLNVNTTTASNGKRTSTVVITSMADVAGLQAGIEILISGLGTTQKCTVAVFSINRIKLATLVKKVSGLDIDGLPVLGDLAIPASSITISSKNIASLPSGFNFYNPLVTGARITQGVSLNYLQSIGGSLKNFKMSLRPGSFDLDLAELPSLEEALAMLIPDIASYDIYSALPNVVPGVFGLRINRIAYDNSIGKMSVEAALDSFTLIPNLLEISTSTVKATLTKTPRGVRTANNRAQITLEINGDVILFGMDLRIQIAYQQTKKAFGIRITSPSGEIKFAKLFDLLGSASNDLTNPAVAALQLQSSAIRNPVFEVNKQSGSLAFRIKGTPTISGFGLFTAEALANTAPRQFILTLNAREFSMAKMIETLTGLDLSGIPFLGLLNGPSDIGVTLSATNVPRIPFPVSSYPLNETTSIDRGLGFTVAFRMPDDCSGDPICNFCQLMLGSQSIIFRVTGINGPQATVSYRLPTQLVLGPLKLYNVDFGFSLSATRPPTVGLTNIELDVPVPFPSEGQEPLKFKGSMLIDPTTNVEASLAMIGIYENAFGIPVFSFGNVDLGFRTNIACPVCVSQLRFGGEVALGQRCYRGNAANCVIAQSIFNVDAVDVKNNYFYFAVNQLSYRKILTAVGVPDNPALVLLDAVNMRNVEASYSSIDRNIPSGIIPGGKTIKAGLTMKGIFNVLFLVNVQVDVTVELLFGVPKSVNALVAVNPITLGPLSMTAASDSSKGPKFEMVAKVLPPTFYMSIDGKISIPALQYTASVLAKIDNNGLNVEANGPIYGFPASFLLKAQFRNLRQPDSFEQFRVAGSFSTLGAQLVDGVKDQLEAASRATKAQLDAAVAEFEKADRAVAAAVGNLDLKKVAEGNAKRAFDSANNALRSAEDTIRGLCSIRDCNGCQNVPKPCTKQHCSCSIPSVCCSGWSCKPCCKTACVPYPTFCGTHCVPYVDPACVTANGVCEGIRSSAFAARVAAQTTLSGAQATFNAAAEATRVATQAVANARLLSRTAAGVRDGFQASFNAVNSAISGLLSAFRINHIGFDVLVDTVNGGRMQVSLDVVAAGRAQTLSTTIDLNNIAAYAAELAKKFYGNFV